MREVPCPQCREILGVPPELERGPIRCGSCGRVIQPQEHSPYRDPLATSSAQPARRSVDDQQDDDDTRNRSLDDDGTPRSRNKPIRMPNSAANKNRRWWIGCLGTLGAMSLLCCGCGGLFVWLASQVETTPFSTNDFSAVFPHPPGQLPLYDSRTITDSDGNSVTLQDYETNMPLPPQRFAVYYIDVPKGADAAGKIARTKLQNTMVDALKRALVFVPAENSRKAVTMAGEAGVEFEGTGSIQQISNEPMYLRVAVVGKKVFGLVALGQDKAKLEPRKNAFFDSFTVPSANNAN